MNQDLEILLEFVSGKIDASSFQAKLYASSSIEKFLSDDPGLPAYSYIGGDNYLFLISQDYNDSGGVLNAQGAIEQFLERKNIPFNKTDEHSELFDIILKAQPESLDVDSKFISKKYGADIDGLDKETAIDKLRDNLLNDFKFIKWAKKWIQSPA